MDKGKLSFEEVRFWIEEAKSCEERQRREFTDKNYYPLLVKYYEGVMYPDDAARQRSNLRKLTFINEFFPNVNALISEIMYQNPEILCEAKKPEAEDGLNIMKSALDYAFNKLDALTENRIALFDMIIAGFCAVEVNHININKTETRPAQGEQEPTNLIGRIGNAIKKAVSKEEVEEEVQKTIPLKEIAYATPDETYLRRWDPINILLDHRADRLKDMRYTIKKVYFSNAEFAARFPEFKDKIKSGAPLPFSLHTEDRHNKSTMLYEFQVKQEGNKYINFLVSPNYLLREIDYWERPYATNGFNLKIGVLHEYGKLYPVSIAMINKAIQDDINNYATFMMETAERNIPKIGYNIRNVKEDGIRGLQSPKINDLVPVDGMPNANIQPIQATSVSKENTELLSLFDRTKEKLWSVSQQRLGQQGENVKFATELQIQEAGFLSRQSDIQEGLRKLLRSELDALKDIIVQFWDGPMWFKITGADKPTWYVPQMVTNPLTGEQIVANPLTDILIGDYELDVDISSALKPNPEKKKQEDIKFLELMISPNMHAWLNSIGWVLDVEMLKRSMKEWGWTPEQYLKQLPPMPQEQPKEPPLRMSVSMGITPADLLNHSVVQVLKDAGIELPMPPAELVHPQVALAHKKSLDGLQQPAVEEQANASA